jgi:tetratricopeptide (TPR) repeat protein
MVDAYGVLGYCYHYLGNDLKAKEFFNKAIDGGSNYFWYSYDLAVLNIKDHNYHAGMALLTKALHIDPQASFKSFLSGAINPLLPQPLPVKDIEWHLGQGYKQCSILLNILNLAIAQGRADDFSNQLKLDIYVF